MIDGQTLIFNSDDIIWEEYSSVSSSKSAKLQSVPVLLIRVKEQKILFKGKRKIKQFLNKLLDGWADLPNELKDFMMSEAEWIHGEEGVRFLDEIASLKGSSLAVSVSVVGHTALAVQPSIGTLGRVFLVNAIHTRPTLQDFNINWLSDFIAVPIQYGFTDWVGSKERKVVPVAYADISQTCEHAASLVIYDFGRSFGVVSRLNIGLRPHRLIEVKRGEGEVFRLRKAVIQSLAKCSAYSVTNGKNIAVPEPIDTTSLRSLEVDELEWSLAQRI